LVISWSLGSLAVVAIMARRAWGRGAVLIIAVVAAAAPASTDGEADEG
jgi:hypothetical protein